MAPSVIKRLLIRSSYFRPPTPVIVDNPAVESNVVLMADVTRSRGIVKHKNIWYFMREFFMPIICLNVPFGTEKSTLELVQREVFGALREIKVTGTLNFQPTVLAIEQPVLLLEYRSRKTQPDINLCAEVAAKAAARVLGTFVEHVPIQ